MRIMLSVLGEGRGHMTQAMAVKDTVEKAGHQVVSVVMGTSRNRKIPAYFTDAIKLPVTQIPTLEFKYSNDRTVNLAATVAGVIKDFPAYRRGLAQIKA